MTKSQRFFQINNTQTTVGFKNKKEMEKYLGAHGFGMQFSNLYSDSEKNHYVFNVTFHGNSVYKMEVIEALPIEMMKSVGFVAFI